MPLYQMQAHTQTLRVIIFSFFCDSFILRVCVCWTQVPPCQRAVHPWTEPRTAPRRLCLRQQRYVMCDELTSGEKMTQKLTKKAVFHLFMQRCSLKNNSFKKNEYFGECTLHI